MPSISATILAFWVAHGSLGDSPYSFEAVPECGTNPKEPACELKPVCDNAHDFRCRPPRWSAARSAWVRVETKEAAQRRLKPMAETLAETAVYLTDCRLPDGSVSEDCELAGWPRGRHQARSLATAAATVTMWESGLREDIQGGYPPAGRGPDREGCVMQIMPAQAANFAPWIEEKPTTHEGHEEVIQTLLGFDRESMRRCFSIGMRILARARSSCRGSGLSWSYATFARYGTGGSCSSYGIHGDFALKRQKTYWKMWRFNPSEARQDP